MNTFIDFGMIRIEPHLQGILIIIIFFLTKTHTHVILIPISY
jgi:hypothetical protein